MIAGWCAFFTEVWTKLYGFPNHGHPQAVGDGRSPSDLRNDSDDKRKCLNPDSDNYDDNSGGIRILPSQFGRTSCEGDVHNEEGFSPRL